MSAAFIAAVVDSLLPGDSGGPAGEDAAAEEGALEAALAVHAAAAETGTAIEVDGAPVHLDMDGVLVRQAVGAGVTVTIDSDAHGASRLDPHMQFGIGTARRGWVEARHVLNTRPLADVRAFVDRKRRRQYS